MSKTKTRPMTSDAVDITKELLKIMENPTTIENDRTTAAALILGVIEKADEGLRKAAQILERVANDQNDEKDAKAAAKWLGGGR